MSYSCQALIVVSSCRDFEMALGGLCSISAFYFLISAFAGVGVEPAAKRRKRRRAAQPQPNGRRQNHAKQRRNLCLQKHKRRGCMILSCHDSVSHLRLHEASPQLANNLDYCSAKRERVPPMRPPGRLASPIQLSVCFLISNFGAPKLISRPCSTPEERR